MPSGWFEIPGVGSGTWGTDSGGEGCAIGCLIVVLIVIGAPILWVLSALKVIDLDSSSPKVDPVVLNQRLSNLPVTFTIHDSFINLPSQYDAVITIANNDVEGHEFGVLLGGYCNGVLVDQFQVRKMYQDVGTRDWSLYWIYSFTMGRPQEKGFWVNCVGKVSFNILCIGYVTYTEGPELGSRFAPTKIGTNIGVKPYRACN